MEDSTLTRIRVPGPVSRPDLRCFTQALRAARQMPGFRGLQGFRGIDQTSEVIVVAEWGSAAAATRAALSIGVMEPPRPPLPRGAGRGSGRPEPIATFAMAGFYEARLLPKEPAAVLLRLALSERGSAILEARERELALRAMAEPGSIRVAGARSRSRALFACRIEFDFEDALWHFLESPLCRDWTRLARRLGQRELWALNLPRLARESHGGALVEERAEWVAIGRDSAPAPTLLQLEVTEPGAARLRASGQLDGAGAVKLRAVAESLARAGCRRLEIDISRLDHVATGALVALVATVRALKALGAEVRLVEREGRFARATRASHLEQSIPAMAGAATGGGE